MADNFNSKPLDFSVPNYYSPHPDLTIPGEDGRLVDPKSTVAQCIVVDEICGAEAHLCTIAEVPVKRITKSRGCSCTEEDMAKLDESGENKHLTREENNPQKFGLIRNDSFTQNCVERDYLRESVTMAEELKYGLAALHIPSKNESNGSLCEMIAEENHISFPLHAEENSNTDSGSQLLTESDKLVVESFKYARTDIDKSSYSLYPQLIEGKDWHEGHIKQMTDSIESNNHDKFFYYEPPLDEDTGCWIPVSIPPMSASEHNEWSRGFCLNGGYIPEGDMGWSQLNGEDKELTMWDVVVEMLLAARGKVTSLASSDQAISWISSNLIEQAWKEMAQTLTEANFGNAQELLEADPPKWLPDSAASACMLCSVRFHPIMCTRHHCRFCGGIFCGECTKGRSLLPAKFSCGDPQRVCDVCCVRLGSIQPYLMDQVSRAAQLPTHDLTDLSTLRSWVNFPWGQSMEYEIYKATNTIRGYTKVGSLKPEKKIPEAILRNAKGLAILTVVKLGMMVTYNVGTGLIVARKDDGTWSPPSAVASFGVGWGAQAGGELIDFIIVLRTTDAVKAFCSDSHLSIGAGISAAFGIIGRSAEADVRAGFGGYGACYTYSCSKGAFVGCSLEGSFVVTRNRENSRFYGSQSINASRILLGSLPRPPAAATLYRALGDLYRTL